MAGAPSSNASAASELFQRYGLVVVTWPRNHIASQKCAARCRGYLRDYTTRFTKCTFALYLIGDNPPGLTRGAKNFEDFGCVTPIPAALRPDSRRARFFQAKNALHTLFTLATLQFNIATTYCMLAIYDAQQLALTNRTRRVRSDSLTTLCCSRIGMRYNILWFLSFGNDCSPAFGSKRP